MKAFLSSVKAWGNKKIRGSVWMTGLRDKWGLLLVLVLVVVIFSFLSHAFFSISNLSIILRQNSILFILAIATTIVIVSGGIDLSIGSNMVFCSIVVGIILRQFGVSGIAFAIIAGLFSGFLIGLINGLMVGRFGINSWLVTLSTMTIVRGLAYVISKGQMVSGIPKEFSSFITMKIGPFSMNIFIAVLIGIVVHIIYSNTSVGFTIKGIGSNPFAALYVGIPINRYYILIYCLSGILSAIAGIILVGNVSSTTAFSNVGIELDAIAGVVVGGTAFSGGVGSIGGTALGVLIIGIIQNGLVMFGVSTHYLKMFRGLVLISVVMINSLLKKND